MKFLITVAVLLAGCAASDETIYVDERFSPGEEAAIQLAADFWHSATNSALRIDLVFRSRVSWAKADRRQLVRVDPSALAYAFRDNDAMVADTLNRSEPEERIGLATDRIARFGYTPVLPFIIAHEFGHHFGMSHVPGDTALMAASQVSGDNAMWLIENRCLREADITELCDRIECEGIAFRRCP